MDSEFPSKLQGKRLFFLPFQVWLGLPQQGNDSGLAK